MKEIIKTTEKDFKNRQKSYTCVSDALKEFATNAFFAPNVKNINIHFDTVRGNFEIINDGDIMTFENIKNVISTYGCESNNTAGNENGVGIKSGASYFVNYEDNFEDSILIIVSKNKGTICGFGAIDSKGLYTIDINDLGKDQKTFMDSIIKKFTDGTVTMIYNTNKISKEDINNFHIDIVHMFTSGLNHVNVEIQINDDESFRVNYEDRHYLNLDYVEKDIKEDYSFNFEGKIYKCDLYSTNTSNVKEEDMNSLDCVNMINDFGVHMGYDNGYMPIHLSQVEILGMKSKPQYNYVRCSLIAHPVEDGIEFANIRDWQKFFSEIGNMNQQKIPVLQSPKKYTYGQNVIKKYEEFYEIVKIFKNNINKWVSVKPTDKCTEDKIDNDNLIMKRYDLNYCDAIWKFRFKIDMEEDQVIKFIQSENEIVFNYSEDSKLIKKLIRGGRNGKNGKNDIPIIIAPIIDTIKKDIIDVNSTVGIQKTIKDYVRKMNNYYAKSY